MTKTIESISKTIFFGKPFELAKISDQQLQSITEKLKAEIKRLEDSIDNINLKFGTGEHLDENQEAPLWFKKLCLALDRHRIALLKAEAEIERRSEIIPEPTLADVFMALCQEKMDPKPYGQLYAIAEKRFAKLTTPAASLTAQRAAEKRKKVNHE